MLTATQKYALHLIDIRNTITKEDRALLPGVHFCNDWDGLPVCDDSPEKSCCTCTFPTVENSENAS